MSASRYAAEELSVGRQAPQPTLYLHGSADGCITADLARGAEPFLAPSSRMLVIDEVGHFLHLQKPAEVNGHILGWVGADSPPGSAAGPTGASGGSRGPAGE
jgi:pimeloyl-ACP methyl ester carboxylesterase